MFGLSVDFLLTFCWLSVEMLLKFPQKIN